MGEVLIKPYELSIWDNELTNTEQKIAVIGSHLLKTPNMAYDIVFTKNKNGEKTLSFKVKYKYFDADTGQMEDNPFAPYLINERKVKLFYDDEWYDFIIKEVEETSDEYTCSYTAYDAFILELSKNGYGIEFSSELNNNLGTALDLATKTLEDTDWLVIDVDTAPPKVNEPVFEARLLTDVTVKNMDNDEDTVITTNEEVPTEILIFYSFISNQNGKYLQFILKQNNTSDYNIDSTNIITATNYRFDKELTFETVEEDGHTTYYIKDGNTRIISYSYVYQLYEAYRLVYQQVNSYDAVMDRIVDQYTDGPNVINHYTDYVYTTSTTVMSYVTNGDNFSTYDNGTLQGWDRYGGDNTNWPEIELTTYPEIDPENPIVDLETIKQIEGYLQVKFNAGAGSYLYNDGIIDNQRFIQSIAKGDKFVFRWRGGKASEDHGTLTKLAQGDIRAKVCFYKEVPVTDGDSERYAKKPISDIISFNGTAAVLNNVISGGTIEHDNEQYILDGVEQVPSSKYLYATDLYKYYWDNDQSKYVIYNEATNTKFLDYYYLTGTAITTVTEEQFNDPTVKFGIFIYCNGNFANTYYYLQDIQLTRLYRDEVGTVLTIGNTPKAVTNSTDYYYMAPKVGDDKNKIPLFLSLEDLANEYELNIENIKPVYNQGNILFTDTNDDIFWVKKEQLRDLYEQFEVQGYSLSKVLTIEASRSNYFNILQTIAETFECWIDIYVEHNADGSIYLDEDGKPLKMILLREFSGKDNFVGFKYGININQISRTVDSNEVVTKLIVDDTDNELVDNGVISITKADSNPSKESYIYRFDYFLNQGLLPREEFTQDLNNHNLSLKQLNATLDNLQQQKVRLENSLRDTTYCRNVYSSMLTQAHEMMNEALDEFEDITGYAYEEYLNRSADDDNDSGDINDSLGEEDGEESSDNSIPYEVDKVKEIIGTIYNSAATENSYRGLFTNIDIEYNNLHQQLNGIQEHAITAVCVQGETAWYLRVKVDDYIVPFKFYVDGVEYETSLSNKNFDIEINSNEVDITDIVYSTNSETGYQLLDSDNNLVTTIHVNDRVLQTFRLVPYSPTEGLKTQINELLQQKNNLIREFSIKYQRFILEGNWSSQDYLSDELYYLDAALAGRTSAFPKVTYNVDVVDVSGLNDYQAYNFNAGEKTYIEDTEFFGWTYIDGVKTPVKEEVIISDIEWHLDDPSQNSITIQNYRDHFEDLFQRVQATVQTVQYNEITYPNTRTIIDEEKRINQALLVASLSRVAGEQRPLTSDGSIVVDGDSIDILNLGNRLNRVRLSSEGITISSDGGYTWSAAITGEGINIGNVISDFINTKEIWIGSKDSPSFRWDKNGISAFRLGNESQDEPRYNFKQFVRYDQYGLYGIDLRNRSPLSEYVVTGLQDIKDTASFAVTWDGFFIRNKYTNGRVEITSEDDFRVIQTLQDTDTYQYRDHERIKIGAIEHDANGNPTKYGININQTTYNESTGRYEDTPSFTTGTDGNITITGTIYATGGDFKDIITVGKQDENNPPPWIEINGITSKIYSSNYQDGAGPGWLIDASGDATFNNITARGAIKTAVFEYAEIQAVGGIFLFRPSSTIRSAEVSDNNIVVTVEKPLLFTEHNWCKISNYTEGGEADDSDVDIDDTQHSTAQQIANNNGLLHVYEISDITTTSGVTYITLSGAAAMVGPIDSISGHVVTDASQFIGGALVDMGNVNNTSNYGIGINSSDNTVNLPARAISLFETTVNNSSDANPKITYYYTAILGTLPHLSGSQVNDDIYNTYLEGTQGIFTDNMYLGNAEQYIAFYTGHESIPQKHLVIKAKEFTLQTGTPNSGGYLYLSSEDHPTGTSGVTINGFAPAVDSTEKWREVIGTRFGVTNLGTIYASNVNISGDITANSGHIANWTIESKDLSTNLYPYGGAIYTQAANSAFGDSGNVYITPGYTTNGVNIGGSSTNSETWTIVAGNGFGVTTDGKLYANNAKISGNINASSGSVANWTIEGRTNGSYTYGGALYTGGAFGTGIYITPGYTPNPAVNIGGSGTTTSETWTITAGSGFGVTTSGKLYANNAKISGNINATSLSTGNKTDRDTGNGIYIDSNGNIYAGNGSDNKFQVTSAGVLTATSGTIGGWTIGSNSLQSSSGSVGLLGAGNSSDDIVFWAGSSSPGSAPFRVSRDGSIVASTLDLTGYATTSDLNSVSSAASTAATKATNYLIDLDSQRGVRLEPVNTSYGNTITLNSEGISVNSAYGALTLTSTGVDVSTKGSGTKAFTFNSNPIIKVKTITTTGISIGGSKGKRFYVYINDNTVNCLGVIGWNWSGTGMSALSLSELFYCKHNSKPAIGVYVKNRSSKARSGLSFKVYLLVTPVINNWTPSDTNDSGNEGEFDDEG